MTTPGPATPGSPDSVALQPEQAQRFAARVDALEEAVGQARDALRHLADVPLATGTGAENAAIASWYRGLLADDTVPAADHLTDELDGVRRAVRESSTAWQRTDEDGAQRFGGPLAGGSP